MNDLDQALRTALQLAFDHLRTDDEINAHRTARVLRIAIDAADAPAWVGDAVAMMYPAPIESSDARWATALGLDSAGALQLRASPSGWRPLPVPTTAGSAFGYVQVHEYAEALLAELSASLPTSARVALALPGVAHGLDEGTCVEHLLLGLVDELAVRPKPPALNELVLLEPNDKRRELIAEKLNELLGHDAAPAGWVARPNSWPLVYFAVAGGAQRPPAPFEQHLTYKDTLTAFVAMPFMEEMLDVFQYGIQGPAVKSKFKAERLDLEHFTGPVVEQIKERIERAHLVIADMTGANANVFLEIGYAWGKNRPTVLLWRKSPDGKETRPPFDVASDSRIEYTTIGHLDSQLTAKLRALYPELHRLAIGSREEVGS
jgi:hypothetical protein